jgi:hypothetical protein
MQVSWALFSQQLMQRMQASMARSNDFPSSSELLSPSETHNSQTIAHSRQTEMQCFMLSSSLSAAAQALQVLAHSRHDSIALIKCCSMLLALKKDMPFSMENGLRMSKFY